MEALAGLNEEELFDLLSSGDEVNSDGVQGGAEATAHTHAPVDDGIPAFDQFHESDSETESKTSKPTPIPKRKGAPVAIVASLKKLKKLKEKKEQLKRRSSSLAVTESDRKHSPARKARVPLRREFQGPSKLRMSSRVGQLAVKPQESTPQNKVLGVTWSDGKTSGATVEEVQETATSSTDGNGPQSDESERSTDPFAGLSDLFGSQTGSHDDQSSDDDTNHSHDDDDHDDSNDDEVEDNDDDKAKDVLAKSDDDDSDSESKSDSEIIPSPDSEDSKAESKSKSETKKKSSKSPDLKLDGQHQANLKSGDWTGYWDELDEKSINREFNLCINSMADSSTSKTLKNKLRKKLASLNDARVAIRVKDSIAKESTGVKKVHTRTVLSDPASIQLASALKQIESLKQMVDLLKVDQQTDKLVSAIQESSKKATYASKVRPDKSDLNPEMKGIFFKDDGAYIEDFLTKFEVATRLSPKNRLTHLLIRATDPETVQPRLIDAIDRSKLNYTQACDWLRKTYVRDDYPNILWAKFVKMKQPATMRIPEWIRQWRAVVVKLHRLDRKILPWMMIKMVLDSVKPSLKIKCEHLEGFNKMDIVEICTKLKDLEIKERKKNAASLNLTTAELDQSEAAQNFSAHTDHHDQGGAAKKRARKTPENREARVLAAQAKNQAAQHAENSRRYGARGATYQSKRGRGRGRAQSRGTYGRARGNRGAYQPKIKSGQFRKKYDGNVWKTRQNATNAHLAPSNFPYCYEFDCMAVTVNGCLEEVPVCVICNTAKSERQGGHTAACCPHEADNLKRGFFKSMPDGYA